MIKKFSIVDVRKKYNENILNYANFTISDRSRLAELSAPFLKTLYGKKILDVGCGPGEYAALFEDYGYNITGIDFSREMIKICKKKVSKAKLICDSFETHTFKEKFDGLWVCNALHNMPAERRAKNILELISLLKPTGAIAITLRYGTFKGFKSKLYFCYSTPNEIIHILKDSDLIHIKTTYNKWRGQNYFTIIFKKLQR